ncbi:hypothetical protein VNO78_03899 [Psophocarpus tetragonolobus]|uniref:Uncharacterized protein n=1 Tax=Psophocarpus tetragonolobus TaxID=3891 RepID=A0AAN9T4W3_PSOTE
MTNKIIEVNLGDPLRSLKRIHLAYHGLLPQLWPLPLPHPSAHCNNLRFFFHIHSLRLYNRITISEQCEPHDAADGTRPYYEESSFAAWAQA